MKGKPFEHYTQFRNNLLLAEWFSNSWKLDLCMNKSWSAEEVMDCWFVTCI
jgi:hypothetical protein